MNAFLWTINKNYEAWQSTINSIVFNKGTVQHQSLVQNSAAIKFCKKLDQFSNFFLFNEDENRLHAPELETPEPLTPKRDINY